MIARIKTYIQGIRLEWQKVSKPDAKEIQGSTITVIVACALLGLYIWLVDGNAAYPIWNGVLGMILLVLIPVGVFSLSRGWEEHRNIAILVSCVPLVVVLISQYALRLDEPLTGFGMAFLRTLFLRTVE